jgi:hypothetical protein
MLRDFFQQVSQVEASAKGPTEHVPSRIGGHGKQGFAHVLRRDGGPLAPNGGAAQGIAQLAHVARPWVRQKKISCARGKLLLLEAGLALGLAVHLDEQVVDEHAHVALALAEWGDFQDGHS